MADTFIKSNGTCSYLQPSNIDKVVWKSLKKYRMRYKIDKIYLIKSVIRAHYDDQNIVNLIHLFFQALQEILAHA